MAGRLLELVITALLLGQTLGWWPFSDSEPAPTVQQAQLPQTRGEDQVKAPAKFEVSNAEQKFLAEAHSYLNLSPLEKCQHSVISKLQRSCGEMSDEELGKFSVHLLNCQSDAERRTVYACSESMTLAECSGPMDATTWNAYHIISNRARSVCYSIQQQRFRKQTEVAINKLSESTLRQLQTVQELEDKHQQIKDFTQESLQSFRENQDQLSKQQEEVLTTHETLKDHIGKNLQQLDEEKTMIQTGQVLLTSMTEEIRKQLEDASSLLEKQEEGRQESHSQIVGDIDNIKHNIDQVWQRVDKGTGELLLLLGNMSSQYQETLHNLQLINDSVSSMVAMLNAMNSALMHNLDWLTDWLGGAKDGLHLLTTLAIHAAFLFLATLCLVFVSAPGLTRVALLVMVTANALAEIKFQLSLSVGTMALLQALLYIGNWSFAYWSMHRSKYHHLQPSAALSASSNPHTHRILNSFPQQAPRSPDDSWDYYEPDTSFKDPAPSSTRDYLPSISAASSLSCPSLTRPLSAAPPLASPSTPNMPPQSIAGSLRRAALTKCKAKTRSGLQCKLPALQGSRTCTVHSNY